MSVALPAPQLATAVRVVDALRREAERIATGAGPVGLRLEAAVFAAVRDPADARPAFEGIWRNERGERCGSLALNADGSFFAEYDLCMPHPAKPAWFVEAVTAWGRDDVVRSEARLLAMPQDDA